MNVQAAQVQTEVIHDITTLLDSSNTSYAAFMKNPVCANSVMHKLYPHSPFIWATVGYLDVEVSTATDRWFTVLRPFGPALAGPHLSTGDVVSTR